MKHVFLLIAALLLGREANAENIGQSEALQKAKAFLQQRNKTVSLDNKTTRQASDEQAYYAFNSNEGGFVIVSGSDRTDAVIGYSDSGTFDED
ncbi:MAG: Spi family protease inhibitor, partial [Bacteroidaceae bacterium]|nr:Spi family protease inhibitor [Bacteroidaceae bacterium]